MPRLAIVVPYTPYQDCPSTPERKLFAVPDDREEAITVLKEYFVKQSFQEGDDIEDEWLDVDFDAGEYGDITVNYNDDMFMYFTFIEE